MKVYKSACRGCHGGCLYDLTIENGKLVKAVPAKDGPLNRGRGCIKGLSIIEQVYHPERLLYPLRRCGARGEGKWARISWEEAYDTIAQRTNTLIREYGPESIATLTGTGRHLIPYLDRFAKAMGTPNSGSAGALICLGPRVEAARLQAGRFGGVDYYGSVRPKGIIVWGTNPAISGADGELQWFIKDALKEGTELLVIDPRPTELTEKAKIWLPIRPGTDGALALCILHVLIRENLYDEDFVRGYTLGFDALKERCREYPPEKAAEITGLPREKILEAARWIGTTKPLGLEQGCAFEQSTNSLDTCRAIHMIPAITGNYDVPGGFVESMEIVPAGLPIKKRAEGKQPEALHGGFPYGKNNGMAHPYCILHAIKTGDPYKIRGLFVHGNNTLLSLAEAKHTYEALKRIDFMVYMDLFMTPTAEMADVVLPAALWPEVDCVFAMPEFGDQVVLCQQKVTQTGECKSDEAFFIELCRKAGWEYGFDKQEDMLKEQMRILIERNPDFRRCSLETLREKGYLAPDRTYFRYRTKGFDTPSGKFEFTSVILKERGLDPLPSWHEPEGTPVSAPEKTEKYPLILITGGRQQPYFVSNNRQIRSLRKREPFPLVTMHPATAQRFGIEEGSWVWIENENGRITQKAKLDERMREDTVNCQMGWWYPEAGAPGYGWDESNANILTRISGEFDSYMGSYRMRGLLCTIYPNRDCQIEERYKKWIQ